MEYSSLSVQELEKQCIKLQKQYNRYRELVPVYLTEELYNDVEETAAAAAAAAEEERKREQEKRHSRSGWDDGRSRR